MTQPRHKNARNRVIRHCKTQKRKTLTSRIKKPDDTELVKPELDDRIFEEDGHLFLFHPATETRTITGIERNGRVIYAVGLTYAIQPGRGKPATGRFQLLAIKSYDVRDITEDEARREGFDSPLEFLRTWANMHDPAREWAFENGYYHYWRGRAYGWQVATEIDLWDMIRARPAARYDSWQLTIKVVSK